MSEAPGIVDSEEWVDEIHKKRYKTTYTYLS